MNNYLVRSGTRLSSTSLAGRIMSFLGFGVLQSVFDVTNEELVSGDRSAGEQPVAEGEPVSEEEGTVQPTTEAATVAEAAAKELAMKNAEEKYQNARTRYSSAKTTGEKIEALNSMIEACKESERLTQDDRMRKVLVNRRLRLTYERDSLPLRQTAEKKLEEAREEYNQAKKEYEGKSSSATLKGLLQSLKRLKNTYLMFGERGRPAFEKTQAIIAQLIGDAVDNAFDLGGLQDAEKLLGEYQNEIAANDLKSIRDRIDARKTEIGGEAAKAKAERRARAEETAGEQEDRDLDITGGFETGGVLTAKEAFITFAEEYGRKMDDALSVDDVETVMALMSMYGHILESLAQKLRMKAKAQLPPDYEKIFLWGMEALNRFDNAVSLAKSLSETGDITRDDISNAMSPEIAAFIEYAEQRWESEQSGFGLGSSSYGRQIENAHSEDQLNAIKRRVALDIRVQMEEKFVILNYIDILISGLRILHVAPGDVTGGEGRLIDYTASEEAVTSGVERGSDTTGDKATDTAGLESIFAYISSRIGTFLEKYIGGFFSKALISAGEALMEETFFRAAIPAVFGFMDLAFGCGIFTVTGIILQSVLFAMAHFSVEYINAERKAYAVALLSQPGLTYEQFQMEKEFTKGKFVLRYIFSEQFLRHMIFGLAMGALTYASGSIWLAVGTHFLNNFVFRTLSSRGWTKVDLLGLESITASQVPVGQGQAEVLPVEEADFARGIEESERIEELETVKYRILRAVQNGQLLDNWFLLGLVKMLSDRTLDFLGREEGLRSVYTYLSSLMAKGIISSAQRDSVMSYARRGMSAEPVASRTDPVKVCEDLIAEAATEEELKLIEESMFVDGMDRGQRMYLLTLYVWKMVEISASQVGIQMLTERLNEMADKKQITEGQRVILRGFAFSHLQELRKIPVPARKKEKSMDESRAPPSETGITSEDVQEVSPVISDAASIEAVEIDGEVVYRLAEEGETVDIRKEDLDAAGITPPLAGKTLELPPHQKLELHASINRDMVVAEAKSDGRGGYTLTPKDGDDSSALFLSGETLAELNAKLTKDGKPPLQEGDITKEVFIKARWIVSSKETAGKLRAETDKDGRVTFVVVTQEGEEFYLDAADLPSEFSGMSSGQERSIQKGRFIEALNKASERLRSRGSAEKAKAKTQGEVDSATSALIEARRLKDLAMEMDWDSKMPEDKAKISVFVAGQCFSAQEKLIAFMSRLSSLVKAKDIAGLQALMLEMKNSDELTSWLGFRDTGYVMGSILQAIAQIEADLAVGQFPIQEKIDRLEGQVDSFFNVVNITAANSMKAVEKGIMVSGISELSEEKARLEERRQKILDGAAISPIKSQSVRAGMKEFMKRKDQGRVRQLRALIRDSGTSREDKIKYIGELSQLILEGYFKRSERGSLTDTEALVFGEIMFEELNENNFTLRALQRLYVEGLVHGNAVLLATSGGKTIGNVIVAGVWYLTWDPAKNNEEKFNCTLVTESERGLENYLGVAKGTGLTHPDIAAMFGLKICNAAVLVKNHQTEELVKALNDPSAIVVLDPQQAGFLDLERTSSPELNIGLNGINHFLIDEIDRLTVSQQRFIRAGANPYTNSKEIREEHRFAGEEAFDIMYRNFRQVSMEDLKKHNKAWQETREQVEKEAKTSNEELTEEEKERRIIEALPEVLEKYDLSADARHPFVYARDEAGGAFNVYCSYAAAAHTRKELKKRLEAKYGSLEKYSPKGATEPVFGRQFVEYTVSSSVRAFGSLYVQDFTTGEKLLYPVENKGSRSDTQFSDPIYCVVVSLAFNKMVEGALSDYRNGKITLDELMAKIAVRDETASKEEMEKFRKMLEEDDGKSEEYEDFDASVSGKMGLNGRLEAISSRIKAIDAELKKMNIKLGRPGKMDREKRLQQTEIRTGISKLEEEKHILGNKTLQVEEDIKGARRGHSIHSAEYAVRRAVSALELASEGQRSEAEAALSLALETLRSALFISTKLLEVNYTESQTTILGLLLGPNASKERPVKVAGGTATSGLLVEKLIHHLFGITVVGLDESKFEFAQYKNCSEDDVFEEMRKTFGKKGNQEGGLVVEVADPDTAVATTLSQDMARVSNEMGLGILAYFDAEKHFRSALIALKSILHIGDDRVMSASSGTPEEMEYAQRIGHDIALKINGKDTVGTVSLKGEDTLLVTVEVDGKLETCKFGENGEVVLEGKQVGSIDKIKTRRIVLISEHTDPALINVITANGARFGDIIMTYNRDVLTGTNCVGKYAEFGFGVDKLTLNEVLQLKGRVGRQDGMGIPRAAARAFYIFGTDTDKKLEDLHDANMLEDYQRTLCLDVQSADLVEKYLRREKLTSAEKLYLVTSMRMTDSAGMSANQKIEEMIKGTGVHISIRKTIMECGVDDNGRPQTIVGKVLDRLYGAFLNGVVGESGGDPTYRDESTRGKSLVKKAVEQNVAAVRHFWLGVIAEMELLIKENPELRSKNSTEGKKAHNAIELAHSILDDCDRFEESTSKGEFDGMTENDCTPLSQVKTFFEAVKSSVVLMGGIAVARRGQSQDSSQEMMAKRLKSGNVPATFNEAKTALESEDPTTVVSEVSGEEVSVESEDGGRVTASSDETMVGADIDPDVGNIVSTDKKTGRKTVMGKLPDGSTAGGKKALMETLRDGVSVVQTERGGVSVDISESGQVVSSDNEELVSVGSYVQDGMVMGSSGTPIGSLRPVRLSSPRSERLLPEGRGFWLLMNDIRRLSEKQRKEIASLIYMGGEPPEEKDPLLFAIKVTKWMVANGAVNLSDLSAKPLAGILKAAELARSQGMWGLLKGQDKSTLTPGIIMSIISSDDPEIALWRFLLSSLSRERLALLNWYHPEFILVMSARIRKYDLMRQTKKQGERTRLIESAKIRVLESGKRVTPPLGDPSKVGMSVSKTAKFFRKAGLLVRKFALSRKFRRHEKVMRSLAREVYGDRVHAQKEYRRYTELSGKLGIFSRAIFGPLAYLQKRRFERLLGTTLMGYDNSSLGTIVSAAMDSLSGVTPKRMLERARKLIDSAKTQEEIDEVRQAVEDMVRSSPYDPEVYLDAARILDECARGMPENTREVKVTDAATGQIAIIEKPNKDRQEYLERCFELSKAASALSGGNAEFRKQMSLSLHALGRDDEALAIGKTIISQRSVRSDFEFVRLLSDIASKKGNHKLVRKCTRYLYSAAKKLLSRQMAELGSKGVIPENISQEDLLLSLKKERVDAGLKLKEQRKLDREKAEKAPIRLDAIAQNGLRSIKAVYGFHYLDKMPSWQRLPLKAGIVAGTAALAAAALWFLWGIAVSATLVGSVNVLLPVTSVLMLLSSPKPSQLKEKSPSMIGSFRNKMQLNKDLLAQQNSFQRGVTVTLYYGRLILSFSILAAVGGVVLWFGGGLLLNAAGLLAGGVEVMGIVLFASSNILAFFLTASQAYSAIVAFTSSAIWVLLVSMMGMNIADLINRSLPGVAGAVLGLLPKDTPETVTRKRMENLQGKLAETTVVLEKLDIYYEIAGLDEKRCEEILDESEDMLVAGSSSMSLSDRAQALAKLAKLAVLSAKPDVAKAHLKSALSFDKNNSEAMNLLFDILVSDKEYLRALRVMSRAYAIDSGIEESLLLSVIEDITSKINSGDYDGLVDVLLSIGGEERMSPETIEKLKKTLTGIGRKDVFIRLLEKLLHRDITDPVILGLLMNKYMEEGRIGDAGPILARALRYEPQDNAIFTVFNDFKKLLRTKAAAAKNSPEEMANIDRQMEIVEREMGVAISEERDPKVVEKLISLGVDLSDREDGAKYGGYDYILKAVLNNPILNSYQKSEIIRRMALKLKNSVEVVLKDEEIRDLLYAFENAISFFRLENASSLQDLRVRGALREALAIIRMKQYDHAGQQEALVLVKEAYRDFSSSDSSERWLVDNKRLEAEIYSMEPMIIVAQDLIRNGEYEKAKKMLQTAIKQHPEDPNAYLLLAEIEEHEGSYFDAARHRERSVSLAPGLKVHQDAQIFRLYIRAGKLEDAYRLYSESGFFDLLIYDLSPEESAAFAGHLRIKVRELNEKLKKTKADNEIYQLIEKLLSVNSALLELIPGDDDALKLSASLEARRDDISGKGTAMFDHYKGILDELRQKRVPVGLKDAVAGREMAVLSAMLNVLSLGDKRREVVYASIVGNFLARGNIESAMLYYLRAKNEGLSPDVRVSAEKAMNELEKKQVDPNRQWFSEYCMGVLLQIQGETSEALEWYKESRKRADGRYKVLIGLNMAWLYFSWGDAETAGKISERLAKEGIDVSGLKEQIDLVKASDTEPIVLPGPSIDGIREDWGGEDLLSTRVANRESAYEALREAYYLSYGDPFERESIERKMADQELVLGDLYMERHLKFKSIDEEKAASDLFNAERVLKQAAKDLPDSGEIHIALAKLAALMGKSDECRKHLVIAKGLGVDLSGKFGTNIKGVVLSLLKKEFKDLFHQGEYRQAKITYEIIREISSDYEEQDLRADLIDVIRGIIGQTTKPPDKETGIRRLFPRKGKLSPAQRSYVSELYLELGRAYVLSGNTSEALKCFASSLKYDKRNSEAMLSLAELIPKTKKALSLIRKASGSEKTRDAALRSALKVYIRTGNIDEAMKLFRTIRFTPAERESFRLDVVKMLLEAAYALRSGKSSADREKEVRLYGMAAELDRDNPSIEPMLAMAMAQTALILAQEGQYDKVLDILKQLNGERYSVLLKSSDTGLMKEALREMLSRNISDETQSSLTREFIRFALARFEVTGVSPETKDLLYEAIGLHDRAVTSSGGKFKLAAKEARDLAQALARVGFTDDQRLLGLDSACPTAHIIIADGLMKTGDIPQAIEAYEKALKGEGEEAIEAGMKLLDIYVSTDPEKAFRVVTELYKKGSDPIDAEREILLSLIMLDGVGSEIGLIRHRKTIAAAIDRELKGFSLSGDEAKLKAERAAGLEKKIELKENELNTARDKSQKDIALKRDELRKKEGEEGLRRLDRIESLELQIERAERQIALIEKSIKKRTKRFESEIYATRDEIAAAFYRWDISRIAVLSGKIYDRKMELDKEIRRLKAQIKMRQGSLDKTREKLDRERKEYKAFYRSIFKVRRQLERMQVIAKNEAGRLHLELDALRVELDGIVLLAEQELRAASQERMRDMAHESDQIREDIEDIRALRNDEPSWEEPGIRILAAEKYMSSGEKEEALPIARWIIGMRTNAGVTPDILCRAYLITGDYLKALHADPSNEKALNMLISSGERLPEALDVLRNAYFYTYPGDKEKTKSILKGKIEKSIKHLLNHIARNRQSVEAKNRLADDFYKNLTDLAGMTSDKEILRLVLALFKGRDIAPVKRAVQINPALEENVKAEFFPPTPIIKKPGSLMDHFVWAPLREQAFYFVAPLLGVTGVFALLEDFAGLSSYFPALQILASMVVAASGMRFVLKHEKIGNAANLVFAASLIAAGFFYDNLAVFGAVTAVLHSFVNFGVYALRYFIPGADIEYATIRRREPFDSGRSQQKTLGVMFSADTAFLVDAVMAFLPEGLSGYAEWAVESLTSAPLRIWALGALTVTLIYGVILQNTSFLGEVFSFDKKTVISGSVTVRAVIGIVPEEGLTQEDVKTVIGLTETDAQGIKFVTGKDKDEVTRVLENEPGSVVRVMVDMKGLFSVSEEGNARIADPATLENIIRNADMQAFLMEISLYIPGLNRFSIENLGEADLIDAFTVIRSRLDIEKVDGFDGIIEELYNARDTDDFTVPKFEDISDNEEWVGANLEALGRYRELPTGEERIKAGRSLLSNLALIRGLPAEKRPELLEIFGRIASAQSAETETIRLLNGLSEKVPNIGGPQVIAIDMRGENGVSEASLISMLPAIKSYVASGIRAVILTDMDMEDSIRDIVLGAGITAGVYFSSPGDGYFDVISSIRTILGNDSISEDSISFAYSKGSDISYDLMMQQIKTDKPVNFIVVDHENMGIKGLGKGDMDNVDRLIPTIALYGIMERYSNPYRAPSVVAVGLSERDIDRFESALKGILHFLRMISPERIGESIKRFMEAIHQIATSV
ncbi:MAG: CPBP family glutamic-type intramembrane protease [Candidatus Tantalella remota]|nr:CPBP family glutamic-type intramembrane protease [Candidatus Tantalella remota]